MIGCELGVGGLAAFIESNRSISLQVTPEGVIAATAESVCRARGIEREWRGAGCRDAYINARRRQARSVCVMLLERERRP